MKHAAELKPIWKSIETVPKGTKVLLRLKYGTAVIGVYYPEMGAEWWCGLPVFTEEQKQEMKK